MLYQLQIVNQLFQRIVYIRVGPHAVSRNWQQTSLIYYGIVIKIMIFTSAKEDM